jgi:hypothetical protein
MLGVGLEVVEGMKRSINVSLIEVHDFSHRQSCILRIVRIEVCVSLCIVHNVCMLPLVTLRTFVFDPIIYIFSF